MYDIDEFYKEHSTDLGSYNNIFELYSEVVELVQRYIEQVANNNVIPTIETYRTIPVQYVYIGDATYDIVSIVNGKDIILKRYANNIPLNNSTKQTFWNNLTNAQKVDILELSGKFIQLLTKRDNDILDKELSKIVSLELYDNSNNKLCRNIDYVLQNNKIYLINPNLFKPAENLKYCMKNIAIDFDTVNSLMASRVKTSYSDIVSKPEYKEMLQGLMYGALGGPTVSNIKNALKNIISEDAVKVFDKYNADELRWGYWNRDNSSVIQKDKLSDFDFIVSAPMSYMSSLDKLQLFKQYMSAIKPSYTNMIISFMQTFSDSLNLRSKDSQVTKVKTPNFIETISYIEKCLRPTTAVFRDYLNKVETMSLSVGRIISDSVNIKNADSSVFKLQKPNLVDIINYIEAYTFKTKFPITDTFLNMGTAVCSEWGFVMDDPAMMFDLGVVPSNGQSNGLGDTVLIKIF